MKKNNGMICVCGHLAEYREDLRFNGYTLTGWRCPSCKEEFYNPEQAQRILLANKLKKKRYALKLNQVKSNLILRIPKEMSDALHLKKGEEVQVQLDEKDRIIVTAK